jgi:hypothetical protein
VQANATNTVALWPGLAASAIAYLKRLDVPRQLLIAWLVTGVAGGWAGALLLLKTPQHTFVHLIPWLLLSGTLLFAFGNKFRAMVSKNSDDIDLSKLSLKMVAVSSAIEFLVAIYGGYFGAGIGFILMGMLAALGMRDVNSMAAIRTVLSVAINAAAVVAFVLARAVEWPHFAVMVLGSLAGGWFGAHYAQKADPQKLRTFVIGVGLFMSMYFFVTTR